MSNWPNSETPDGAVMSPVGQQVAFDAVELWVADLDRTRRWFTSAFGFDLADASLVREPDEMTACLVCGDVTVVLRQGTSAKSRVSRHVARHGDTVGEVALVCPDAKTIVERAYAHGLDVSGAPEAATIDLLGDGTLCHGVRVDRLLQDVVRTSAAPRMQRVDHVAHCLPWGTAESVARTYEAVFGLARLDIGECEDVGDAFTGMRSIVLRSGGGFTVVLTEPAAPMSVGQTQRFLDAHDGPGVQHIAIAYDDLVGAVDLLRARGVEFLPIPDAYYRQAQRRLDPMPLPWDALRRLEILVDAEDRGLLFQLFTQPVSARGTFFLELIQRVGATGFGANNVRALFAAVEATTSGRPADPEDI